MGKFLSRKFILSLLVVLAELAKQFLGINFTDTLLEQVADAIVLLGTVISYLFAEAKVDAAAAAKEYIYVPLPEGQQKEGE